MGEGWSGIYGQSWSSASPPPTQALPTPAGPSPTPAAPPPSPPTWAPAVDSAAGTRRSLFTAQERPRTTGLSLAHFFFFFFFSSPAKNVIKGREGRPRKDTDCIRLDSELLSGKMANALRVTLHLSSQNQDQRQPSHWWAESLGLLADSSL